jgi:RNA polymerase sigma-70 factor (ECF subfamily)
MIGERPTLKLVAEAKPAPEDQVLHEIDWSIMMTRSQAGDNSAYRRLLNAVVPYLRARALVRLGSADEAEDAVQDTLVTIHEARQSYDPARPFGPWLVAIAERRISDRLRRRRRRHRLREAMLADDPAHASPPRQDRVVLDGRALEAAIASLTPEQAQAIRLLKLQERSLADTAAQTGQTEGALKAVTHRALKALRRHLFEGPRP